MSDMLEEGLAQMDKDLGIEPETPAEESAEERQRNEKGQFVAEEQVEPEQETEPEPTEETPAEELLAGKYKTPEELERGYKELEARFGSQGADLGELRKAVDQMNERLEAPQEQGVSLDQNTVDWFDEETEKNPYGAAVWALKNDRSGVLYHRAVNAWHEEDPSQAVQFQLQLAQNQMRQEMAATAQPIQDQEMARAFLTASKQHPDVQEGLEEMIRAAADRNPVATDALIERAHSGDYETRVAAYSGLIALAKGHRVDPVQATRDAEGAQAEAARRAKQSGVVATQTQAVSAESVDENEQWLRDNFDPFAKKYYADEEESSQ